MRLTSHFTRSHSRDGVWAASTGIGSQSIGAKGVIVGALGYLILPADMVPDLIPGAGYGDDWAALVTALGTVAAYVKDEHKLRAAVQAEKIFGLKGH